MAKQKKRILGEDAIIMAREKLSEIENEYLNKNSYELVAVKRMGIQRKIESIISKKTKIEEKIGDYLQMVENEMVDDDMNEEKIEENPTGVVGDSDEISENNLDDGEDDTNKEKMKINIIKYLREYDLLTIEKDSLVKSLSIYQDAEKEYKKKTNIKFE